MNQIKQFVNTIASRFESLNLADEDDQKLPPSSVLEKVCQVLINVSCLSDEDRYPSFRVCFIRPDSELLDVYVYSHSLLFEHPISFSVQELHKLAPALNKNMSYLVLDIDSKPINIIGIIASYTAWEKIITKEVASGIRMPRIPNIAVNGPAKLDACFGEAPLVSFNAGSCLYYRTDTFTSTFVADQLRNESGVSEDCRLKLLYRIIRQVKTYGHGGQLFIIPDKGQHSSVLNIKYRLPCRSMFTKDMESHMSGPSRDKEIIAYADLIAKFAEVDGAVVLTKNFDLLGFGAETVADMTDRKPPSMCFIRHDNTEDKTKHFDDNGMRHRAGYRLCEAIDGAVAIIFSQDGIIKACTKHDGKVVVYDNVALPLF